MGGKGEGRLPFRKKEVRDSNTKRSLAMQNSFGEWRGTKSVCACPKPTHARATSPAVFEEHYKTAGLAPLNTKTAARNLAAVWT